VAKETRRGLGSSSDIAISPVVAGIENPVIHSLLCATDYGILMTDSHGNDMLCNPRFGELFDINPEMVVHSSREEVRRIALTRVADPDAFNEGLERVYADPSMELEDEIELTTHPPRIIRRYTAPVFNIHGDNIGRVWTFQDVTENRRLQREVAFYAAELRRQLDQQRLDFLATAGVLESINAVTGALAVSTTESDLLSGIARSIHCLAGHDCVALLIQHGGRFSGSACLPNGRVCEVAIDLGKEPHLQRFVEDSAWISNSGVNLYTAMEGSLARVLGRSLGSVCALTGEGELTGLLVFGASDTGLTQTVMNVAHVSAICDQVSLALRTYKLRLNLQSAYDDLRSAQKQMVESAKLAAVGTLAAAIAHDIRNIMTPLQLELMGNDNHDLGPIRAQVDRLSALTHQLLALSRPTAVHSGPVCINELLTHIRPLVQPQADVDGVRINLRVEKKLPPVCGSASRLEHLFINLFLNSISAMASEGGSLTVKACNDEGSVRVDVIDTGKGIEPEHLPHIFEPFYTTRANGTGLGLFSAKTIVEDHDGRIAVKSKIGKGSCFSIWLPIVTPEVNVSA